VDDQYYIGGEGLLVKPVTEEGATSTQVYISDNRVSATSSQLSLASRR
jgi:alpha 1,3-glucosidase